MDDNSSLCSKKLKFIRMYFGWYARSQGHQPSRPSQLYQNFRDSAILWRVFSLPKIARDSNRGGLTVLPVTATLNG